MKEKIKMDVNKCLTDLMEQYEYEDIKELFEALNNSIFKKELFALTAETNMFIKMERHLKEYNAINVPVKKRLY